MNGESRLTFDGATLTVNPTASSTATTLAFGNGDNATIASYYSMVFQVNSSNTQTGRTYAWNKAGTGYGNGSNLMSLTADTNVLYVNGSVNSKAYSAPGNSNAGTYQYGLTNSPTWNVNQGSYTNNNSTAPDGSTTAATYTLTVNSWDLYQTIAVTSGVVYRVGVWVRLGTATNFCIVVNNTQAWNTVSGKAFNSSDGLSTSKWTHVSLTFTGPSTGNMNLHIGGHSESITQQTAGTVFVWNWEVTTGNSTWISNIDDEVRLPSSSIFTSRGLLGLGTTSPVYTLDVQSNITSEPYVQARFLNTNGSTPYGGILVNGSNQAHIRFLTGTSTWGGSGAKQWQIRTGIASNVDALSIYSWTTGSDILYLNSSGNVGINNTTPQYKLDVYNTGIAASIGGTISPGSFAGLHFGYLETGNTAYRKSALVFERTDNNGQGGNASGKIHFLLNNVASQSATALTSAVLTIDSDASGTNGSARVGIANRNPAYPLEVNGAISCNDIIRTSNFRLSGTMVLSGSGAEIGNSTGTRLSESYGALWNMSDSVTWHHQIINGSSLIGFQASGGNFGSGRLYASGDVIAYYSDKRLKHNLKKIDNSLEKINSLTGYTYQHNELGQTLLSENPYKVHAGLIAQEVQRVLPEVVTIAPFDLYGYDEHGNGISKSGEDYLTIKYERIVPLLIEAIKELNQKVEAQQTLINSLLNKDN